MADSPKHHTVATGRVFNLLGESMIHNVPLPANHVRVQLNTTIDANYALLMPTPDVEIVAQAVGSFVTWPVHLLTLGHPSKSKGKKSLLGDHSLSSPQKQPSKPVQAISSRFRICLEEYAVGARLEHSEDFMIPLEFELEVYGRPSSDYITNKVLKEILTHGMASTNACNFYIRYLFKNFIAPSGLDDKFKIINPHTFAGHGPDMKKDLSIDLLDIFISRAAPGAQTLFLAPYCQGYGFVAILHKSSLTLPPCPRQPKKSSHCGCYVMKFMKEIIMHNADTIPTQYFADTYCTVYSSS
ncbi:uncharacterized protein LOC114757513 [Neltuma alba]|uniref:uncharacterized protein LOC114757513 n=1 Tax=Neltuma alba TaxID=207710 RepID=UPI0010A55BDE|nr:uncharacterized protein LOC114757513 [Prosopis alba]